MPSEYLINIRNIGPAGILLRRRLIRYSMNIDCLYGDSFHCQSKAIIMILAAHSHKALVKPANSLYYPFTYYEVTPGTIYNKKIWKMSQIFKIVTER